MITPEILILLGIALLGIYICLKLIRRTRNTHHGQRKSKPQGKVDRQTHNKLMRLLGGNRQTLDRLLNQARIRNPHKSEQWYWEKVLYDLERDRWR